MRKHAQGQTGVSHTFTRRDFLQGSSVATMMAMMGGIPLRAEEKEPKERGLGPPLNCAVIGCGPQGRELITIITRLANKSPVLAVCDTYPAYLRRGKEAAPEAQTFEDYRQVLANKEVRAVFVATPTHLHKDIVLAALAAGKHVYCEAPMAHTIEDAREIAKAARATPQCNFQVGLQKRSDLQTLFLLPFMRSGAAGTYLKARGQWHKKTSWRRTSPNPQREQELNWRLRRATSPGLIGEVGIHQVDLVNWFFAAHPLAVTGFGGILHWKDGRDVPDTVQAVFEYPSGASLSYEATLGNSFETTYVTFYGVESAVVLREGIGWLFKEVDAAMIGWEVFAAKQQFYKETGLILRVDSSKQGFLAVLADEKFDPGKDELSSCVKAFVTNSNSIMSSTEPFIETYGPTAKGLDEIAASTRKAESWVRAAGYQEGFEAAVTVAKANEAILNKQRIVYQKEWFQL